MRMTWRSAASSRASSRVQDPALGREEADAAAPVLADGLDGAKDRLGLQDHSFQAPEGPVVDLPVLVLGEIPQVVHDDPDPPPVQGPLDDPPRKDAGEHLGEDRDYIKSHSTPKGRPEGR